MAIGRTVEQAYAYTILIPRNKGSEEPLTLCLYTAIGRFSVFMLISFAMVVVWGGGWGSETPMESRNPYRDLLLVTDSGAI